MLIPVREISRIWGIRPNSILHVGAHLAEEYADYAELQWAEEFGIIWIEAQEDLLPVIESTISGSKGKVVHAAVWDEDDVELELKITNNSQSTSLLNFGTHKEDYPNIEVTNSISMRTKRIDSILDADAKIEFLNLDIQGVELRALKSLGARIKDARWIYTEVNKQSVYKDCALISEIDLFLAKQGFTRVATFWVSGRGWGDALYVANYYQEPLLHRWSTSLKFFIWKFKLDAIRVTSDYWNTLLFRLKIKKR